MTGTIDDLRASLTWLTPPRDALAREHDRRHAPDGLPNPYPSLDPTNPTDARIIRRTYADQAGCGHE